MAVWGGGGDKWGLSIKVHERSDLTRDETTKVGRENKRLNSEEPHHEGAGKREVRESCQKVKVERREET